MGEGGVKGGLLSTINDYLAVKSTFHVLSYTKSKSTHTKFKMKRENLKTLFFNLIHSNTALETFSL